MRANVDQVRQLIIWGLSPQKQALLGEEIPRKMQHDNRKRNVRREAKKKLNIYVSNTFNNVLDYAFPAAKPIMTAATQAAIDELKAEQAGEVSTSVKKNKKRLRKAARRGSMSGDETGESGDESCRVTDEDPSSDEEASTSSRASQLAKLTSALNKMTASNTSEEAKSIAQKVEPVIKKLANAQDTGSRAELFTKINEIGRLVAQHEGELTMARSKGGYVGKNLFAAIDTIFDSIKAIVSAPAFYKFLQPESKVKFAEPNAANGRSGAAKGGGETAHYMDDAAINDALN